MEINKLLKDTAPLIFTYGKYLERYWSPVIPFTLLRLPGFTNICGGD